MNIKNQIEKTRGQITALEAQLAAPENSGLSRAELRKALVAQIDAWHEQARELAADGLRKLAAGGDPDLIVGTAHEYDAVRMAVREQAIDTRALLAFAVGKSEMLARFKPILDEMPEGLDANTRAQRLAEIRRQIVEAEVREEDLIRKAEADDVLTDPRPDQRPEAALLIGYGQ